MRQLGGWVSWYAKASRPGKFSTPKGCPAPRRTPSPKPSGTPPAGATSWWAWGGGRIPCTPRWRTESRPSRPLTALSGATLHSMWRDTGRPAAGGGGDFNFDLDYPLRAPPSVVASLLSRRLVDADLELASALGRDPLSWYHGPASTRPSRIDGLLVDTRLAT